MKETVIGPTEARIDPALAEPAPVEVVVVWVEDTILMKPWKIPVLRPVSSAWIVIPVGSRSLLTLIPPSPLVIWSAAEVLYSIAAIVNGTVAKLLTSVIHGSFVASPEKRAVIPTAPEAIKSVVPLSTLIVELSPAIGKPARACPVRKTVVELPTAVLNVVEPPGEPTATDESVAVASVSAPVSFTTILIKLESV
jgi:hypothetical protein